jgi:outer membrane immunogenic protein
MNKLLIATTAAVALATVGTAGAADLPMKAPPMVAAAPIYTWTGCYVSGGVGYGMWNQDNHDVLTVAVPAVGGGFVPAGTAIQNVDQTAGGRGWLFRAGVGCDYQVGPSFVIGAFGDFDWENIHGNFQSLTTGFVGNEKLSRSWHAGGRIGWLPYPNLLTFFSGGFTQARFDGVTMTDPTIPQLGGIPGSILNFSVPATTYSGWFIGGGTEYRLPFAQNLTWKTEYRFAQYRAEDLPVTVCVLSTICAGAGFAEHNEKFVQTVTTSLVWRFNWGGPVVARY